MKERERVTEWRVTCGMFCTKPTIKDVIWWCCSTLKPETNLFLEKPIATQPWFNMFQTTKVYMSGTRSLLVVGIVAFVSACELKEFKNAAWQKSLPSPLPRPMPCMMHDVSWCSVLTNFTTTLNDGVFCPKGSQKGLTQWRSARFLQITNRPFFHIVRMTMRDHWLGAPLAESCSDSSWSFLCPCLYAAAFWSSTARQENHLAGKVRFFCALFVRTDFGPPRFDNWCFSIACSERYMWWNYMGPSLHGLLIFCNFMTPNRTFQGNGGLAPEATTIHFR